MNFNLEVSPEEQANKSMMNLIISKTNEKKAKWKKIQNINKKTNKIHENEEKREGIFLVDLPFCFELGRLAR